MRISPVFAHVLVAASEAEAAQKRFKPFKRLHDLQYGIKRGRTQLVLCWVIDSYCVGVAFLSDYTFKSHLRVAI